MRLLYCYPSYFTEELIDEIASNDKVLDLFVLTRQPCSRFRPSCSI